MSLRDVLALQWGISDATVTVHDGGMNSSTWYVDEGDRRWVAKSVPGEVADDFLGGLTVATRLSRAGIRSGASMSTPHTCAGTTGCDRPYPARWRRSAHSIRRN